MWGSMGMKPELFIIDAKAVEAVTSADVLDTFKAMRKVGIAHPPTEHFIIAFDVNIFSSNFFYWEKDKQYSPETQKLRSIVENYKDCSLGIELQFSPGEDYSTHPDRGGDKIYFRCRRFYINIKTFKILSEPVIPEEKEKILFQCIYQTLVVLLSTKNAQKDRVQNKSTSASSRTRNASKNFAYTTTIRIGKITENCSSGGTGSPMRPHLRRGHVRNQPYGEGRREIKQIFIAPVFINADKEYVESQRIAYKIRA
jgi:hypothetical protein